MRYHNITKDDMLNGEGLRVVLWVSGCSHHCKGCHNRLTWDSSVGLEFDDDAKQEIFEQLDKDYISGLTLSGGDPLHPENIRDITKLAKQVKERFPDKTIWLYTGFLFEDIANLEITKYVDVIVEGRFEKDLKDTKLHWMGSSNQNVIRKQKDNTWIVD